MERREFFRSSGRFLLIAAGMAGTGFLALNGRIRPASGCTEPGICSECGIRSSCRDPRKQLNESGPSGIKTSGAKTTDDGEQSL